jgi:hypothetical protein
VYTHKFLSILTMYFLRESDLQQFLFDFFEEAGHSPLWEMPTTGGGRVDIVTTRYVIECKKRLSRSNLFEATGQMTTYCNDFPDKIQVVAGPGPFHSQGRLKMLEFQADPLFPQG